LILEIITGFVGENLHLSSKLSGFENHYKIKLRASGYRLVYEVIDNDLFVLVLVIGKRDRNTAYKKDKKR